MSDHLRVGKPANDIPPGQRCHNCNNLSEEKPDNDGNPFFCLIHEERMGPLTATLYWCGEWTERPS